MRFEIFHEVIYEYSRPVYLEPHTFFLRPREDAAQRLLKFDIEIEPTPTLSCSFLDSLGNQAFRAWFKETSAFLKIKVCSDVETQCGNPFNYLLDDSCVQLPVRYPPLIQQSLGVYQAQETVPASVVSFSDKIASAAGYGTTAFLLSLCREMAENFKKINRPDGGPWPACLTLDKRQGSCRDLTVLFMQCCRVQGLASRFTSGYYEGESDKEEKELHAWAEVFLEGGGWRGFDPTSGLAVNENYAALASANLPEMISPVQGTFRGDLLTSKMSTRITLKKK